jgi:hypothetical protein
MSKSTKSYQLWMCKYCGRYDVTESSGSFPQHSENCDRHENRGGYKGPHHWVRQGKVDYSRYQEITADWKRTRARWRREEEWANMNPFEQAACIFTAIKNKLF